LKNYLGLLDGLVPQCLVRMRKGSVVLIFLGGVFLLYAVIIGMNSFGRYSSFKKELMLKSKQFELASKKKQELIDKHLELNQNDGWEHVGRLKLGLIKSDEKVFSYFKKHYD